MPVTTKVVSSNPVDGEVYSIQHYMVKICQWLATRLWFSLGTPVSSTNKTDHHSIPVTGILLKVALSTITHQWNLVLVLMLFMYSDHPFTRLFHLYWVLFRLSSQSVDNILRLSFHYIRIVSCAQCCLRLWIVHSWLSFRLFHYRSVAHTNIIGNNTKTTGQK